MSKEEHKKFEKWSNSEKELEWEEFEKSFENWTQEEKELAFRKISIGKKYANL
jgi:hypothetical protein